MMGQYLQLQIKRLGRFLPLALCITALLLGGMLVAAQQLLGQSATSEDNQKVRLAIAGQTQHNLFQMGFAALSTLDNTRFSMEVLQMEEAAAESALRKGDISAYAVIPDGFMESALKGNLKTIRFVSSDNAGDTIALFKAEITRVVSDLVIGAQKGVFGMEQTLRENGLTHRLPGQMDKLSLKYVDFILLRDQIYTVEELGVTDQLSLEGAVICGLCILLVLLMCLPFAPVMIESDYALARMLHARRISAVGQMAADVLAYGLAVTLMVTLPTAAAAVLFNDVLAISVPAAVCRLLPVLFALVSLSYLFYSVADHLIGGVLIHFFGTLALCFVSGCLYPVFFFPPALQQVANRLPTGLARSQLAGCLTGADTTETALWLVGYGCLFVLVAGALRLRRIKGVSQ